MVAVSGFNTGVTYYTWTDYETDRYAWEEIAEAPCAEPLSVAIDDLPCWPFINEVWPLHRELIRSRRPRDYTSGFV